MSKQIGAMVLLVAGLAAGSAQAQSRQAALRSYQPGSAEATSNAPTGAGEASTMTNGVPNLLTANVQPGELGIQSRLTMRPTTPYGGDPGLKMMGAPGVIRPVLISPPECLNEPLQPVAGPYLDREEVGGRNQFPVSVEKLFPGRLPAALGRRFDTVLLQDIGDGATR